MHQRRAAPNQIKRHFDIHRSSLPLSLETHYPKVKYVRKPVASFAENGLNQMFNVLEKDKVWTGDITYIYTDEGWLYLAVMIDLFSREIVGWHRLAEINYPPYVNTLYALQFIKDVQIMQSSSVFFDV